MSEFLSGIQYMKKSELHPDKLVASVKIYYQGEQWEIYRYVDTASKNIDYIIDQAKMEIDSIKNPISNVLRREDVAKKLTNPITDSE